MNPALSIVLPAHNPDTGRLDRVLHSLFHQTLTKDLWELVLVDNASQPPIRPDLSGFPYARIVSEPVPGLTRARKAGFRAAKGTILVLVDDDNLLDPDYLEHALDLFRRHPELVAAGGEIRPEFSGPLPDWWTGEFQSLLCLRHLGDTAITERDRTDPATGIRDYPECAPVGAGMVLRATALQSWLEDSGTGEVADRTGSCLTSGGDNDIILTLIRRGGMVGYYPGLRLTHLIPSQRLEPDYLARLNEGISRSWVRVLQRHGANPWSPVPRWTVPWRKARAWFRHRAWSGPVARIRWRGACGHFDGRADILT